MAIPGTPVGIGALITPGGAQGPGGAPSDPVIGGNYLYYADDFNSVSWTTTAGGPAFWSTYGSAPAYAATDDDHFGVVSFSNGQGLNIQNTPGVNFSALKKAVIRFIVKQSASTTTGTNEWICGFMNSLTNEQSGALFSYALGFTGLPNANGVPGNVDASRGIIAGTYDSITGGTYGYIQTNYLPSPGVWMDMIISLSPTQANFYLGSYGRTAPPLVATITNNLPLTRELWPAIANFVPSNILSLDRAEILWQTLYPNRFMGSSLVSL
jgi:hypothetical protein